ncbi:hypothetical protein [Alkalihalobacterium bogoriense]|uniref:hypothetical protein n=1 Tax=Alkalihalobacterium bogoriense TaxID=246272 RepID=UPI00047A12ED|nr:hypothetical protein [Alkalihalobacterium bogoriense]
MKKWGLVFCSLIMLAGCFHGTESNMAITNPTSENVPSQYGETDLFVWEDIVYVNAESIDWVKQLELTIQERLTNIKNQSVYGGDFSNGTASILPVGTKVYTTKERKDILIAKVGTAEVRYLGWREG